MSVTYHDIVRAREELIQNGRRPHKLKLTEHGQQEIIEDDLLLSDDNFDRDSSSLDGMDVVDADVNAIVSDDGTEVQID